MKGYALYKVTVSGKARYVMAPTLRSAVAHVGSAEDLRLVTDCVEVAEPGAISPTAFARSFAAKLGYSLEELRAPCRLRKRSRAREEVALALQQQYHLRPGEIADILQRDRSTVVHMLDNAKKRGGTQ